MAACGIVLASPASARIDIWAARIAEGDLWIMGTAPNADVSVTLDESFTERADSRGRFEFRVPYHPASCMVQVRIPTEARTVVVANCGQTGPRGEAGPAGPAGPPGPAGTPSAAAGEPPATSADAPVDPSHAKVTSCGSRSAAYTAESGAKVWIVRRGTLNRQNPLRPAPGEAPLIVLQVQIEGRMAAAFGPTLASLQQGGSPEQLEQESGNQIEWLRSIDPLPETLPLQAGAGGGIAARLAFEQCGSAPRAAAEAARPARRRTDTPPEEPGRPEIPRGLSIPRSAIGDLPKPR